MSLSEAPYKPTKRHRSRSTALAEQLRQDLERASSNLDASIVGRPFRMIKREIELCLDYLDGMPLKILVHRYGFNHRYSVCRIVRKYGCPTRNKPKTPR